MTGAAGFIGLHLCKALIKMGYEVVAVDLGGEDRIGPLAKSRNFTWVKGDVTNFDKILEILKKYKPEGLFHMAAALPPQSGQEDPFLFFNVNVLGTLNVLEACRLAGVKKIVCSSSMSVYGRDLKYLPVDEKCPENSSTFYGLSKLQGEEIAAVYARKYGLKIICLRYGVLYGPGRNRGGAAAFMKNALSGATLRIFENSSWDFVWSEDIIKADIAAFEKIDKLKFQIINVGSGQETNLNDLAKKIVKMTGSKSKIEFCRKRPAHRFFTDIKKAERLLSFRPTPLETGLSEYIKFFKK